MKNKGFTLTELLITITILALISGAVYAGFTLSQKAYRESEISAEITQNGRVILERMNREVHQAKEIAGDFPEDKGSAEDEIMFEDGHITDSYHYIHYFKTGDTIEREVVGYYFSGDGSQSLVPWNAVPPAGQTLLAKTLEEAKTIGEWVSDLKIWGTKIINIALSLEKKDKSLYLETKISGRNL
jgi:prepilin-type N-terminal cleavage/methylation domain-containing protein